MSITSLTSTFNRLTMGIVLTVLLAVSGFAVVQAKLYSCVSPSGTTIYTDSPSQLGDCTPISLDYPHQTLGSEDRSMSNPTETLNQKDESVSNSHPSPPNLSIDTKSKSVPQDHQSSSEHPVEQQPCVSSINPLNPLLNRPCTEDSNSKKELNPE